jgi:hypothetical protein
MKKKIILKQIKRLNQAIVAQNNCLLALMLEKSTVPDHVRKDIIDVIDLTSTTSEEMNDRELG